MKINELKTWDYMEIALIYSVPEPQTNNIKTGNLTTPNQIILMLCLQKPFNIYIITFSTICVQKDISFGNPAILTNYEQSFG